MLFFFNIYNKLRAFFINLFIFWETNEEKFLSIDDNLLKFLDVIYIKFLNTLFL